MFPLKSRFGDLGGEEEGSGDLKELKIQEKNRGAAKKQCPPMRPPLIQQFRREVSPAFLRMIGSNHLKNKLFLTGFFPSNMIGIPSHAQIEPSDTFMA